MAEISEASVSSTPRRRRPRWAVADKTRPDETEPTEDRYHSRTIERALDVLEIFTPGAMLSLKEIASITKQPEPSLYRVVLTLQKRGYLSQRDDGTYELTSKVLYGRVLDEADSVRQIARPVLNELVMRFDETASLSYSFGNYIQVLDSIETFQTFRITNRPGRIIPPHCSAMGKSILAFLPDEAADHLLEAYGMARRTEHSIGDRHALSKELKSVREVEWACDREESTLGQICYGAPIRNKQGRAIAALSVSSPAQRLTSVSETQIREAVRDAAKRISQQLASS